MNEDKLNTFKEKNSERTVVVRYTSTNEIDVKNAVKSIIEAHSEDRKNTYSEAL